MSGKKATYSLHALIQGGGWLTGARGLTLLGNIALMALIPRSLSLEEFGVWAAISSSIGLLSIFNFGLGLAGRNRLAVAKYAASSDAQAAVFWSLFLFLAFAAAVLSLAFILSSLWVNYEFLFTTKDQLLAEKAGNYFSIIAVLYFISIPFCLIDDLAFSYHRFRFLASFQFVFLIAPQLLGFFLSLCSPYRLEVLLVSVYALRIVVAIGFTIYFVNSNGWSFSFPGLSTIVLHVRSMIGSALQFSLITTASFFLLTTDTFFVNKLLGVSIAGQFSLVQRIYFSIITMYGLIMAPMWNFYTDAATLHDWQWIRRAFSKTLSISLTGIGAISLLLVPAIHPIIRFWSGVSLEFGYGVVVVICAWSVANVWKIVIGNLLSGINELKYQSFALVIGALISIPLKICLAKSLGIAGVPLGTVLSLVPLILVGTVQPYLIFRQKDRFCLESHTGRSNEPERNVL